MAQASLAILCDLDHGAWLINLSRTKGLLRTTHGPDAEDGKHFDEDQESHSLMSGNSSNPIDRIDAIGGEFGRSNCADQSGDSVGESSPENSADVAELGSGAGQHYDSLTDQTLTPTALPPIVGDSKNIAPHRWESLSANERVAFLQRWLMYAEVKYKCPVDHWPEAFAAEWRVMGGSELAFQCIIDAEQKVAAGKSVLNYVARAMEGDLPHDAEQWRTLYVQAYHITGLVNRACASLQCKIDAALIDTLP
jgi:hypothetical protein